MFLPLHLITSLFNFYLEMIVGDEAPGLAWVTLHYDMDIILHLCLTLTSKWGVAVLLFQWKGGRGGGPTVWGYWGYIFKWGRGGRGEGRDERWDRKWKSYKEIQSWWSLDISLYKYKAFLWGSRQTSWWWLGPVTSNIEWSDTLGELARTGSRTFNTK